jgi:hypothetical protein
MPANENDPLTTFVNGSHPVGDTRLELVTPSLSSCDHQVVNPSIKGLSASEISACTAACTNLDDLAQIVSAWLCLPEAIRRAIMALIEAFA